MTSLLRLTLAACLLAALFCERASGQDAGTRRALIVCGLAGDADHRKLFAESLEKIYTGLTSSHGFLPQNVIVVWGDAPAETDGPAVKSSRGPATRELLAEVVTELQQALQPQDGLWLFVLGHAHYDGRYSWLNLPGPDIQHIELGKLLAGIRAREQVFFLTTAASGFFIKPLAQPGRIVIAATEPDLEVNETVFPHKLATALSSPPMYSEFDLDRDGRMTLLDLYLWTARSVAEDYSTAELLATEHAQLDDNADGRGSELQAAFLPEELGGRLPAGKDPPLVVSGEGALARSIWMPFPLAPPVPPRTAE